ncbi:sugar-phosphatase [soil metagenome]|nr:HAD-IIB family hydrolase [Chthoniobacterales bacterium]
MPADIRLLSTDFDGTLVEHARDPVFDRRCMALIAELQKSGAVWAINTGRSVDLLESGLTDFAFPVRPDYILTSERDVFRPCTNGGQWEAFGDWNSRVALEHAELFTSAASVLDDVLDFVNQNTRARVIHDRHGVEGLIAQNEEEMERIVRFIDEARVPQPKFHYQRNTVYLRFCHTDYHKGAALAELSRLLDISRDEIFAAGDHHNDLSMLDGRYAEYTACPSNAIDEVKQTVRNSGGYVAESCCGAGTYEALLYYSS